MIPLFLFFLRRDTAHHDPEMVARLREASEAAQHGGQRSLRREDLHALLTASLHME